MCTDNIDLFDLVFVWVCAHGVTLRSRTAYLEMLGGLSVGSLYVEKLYCARMESPVPMLRVRR